MSARTIVQVHSILPMQSQDNNSQTDMTKHSVHYFLQPEQSHKSFLQTVAPYSTVYKKSSAYYVYLAASQCTSVTTHYLSGWSPKKVNYTAEKMWKSVKWMTMVVDEISGSEKCTRNFMFQDAHFLSRFSLGIPRRPIITVLEDCVGQCSSSTVERRHLVFTTQPTSHPSLPECRPYLHRTTPIQ